MGVKRKRTSSNIYNTAISAYGAGKAAYSAAKETYKAGQYAKKVYKKVKTAVQRNWPQAKGLRLGHRRKIVSPSYQGMSRIEESKSHSKRKMSPYIRTICKTNRPQLMKIDGIVKDQLTTKPNRQAVSTVITVGGRTTYALIQNSISNQAAQAGITETDIGGHPANSNSNVNQTKRLIALYESGNIQIANQTTVSCYMDLYIIKQIKACDLDSAAIITHGGPNANVGVELNTTSVTAPHGTPEAIWNLGLYDEQKINVGGLVWMMHSDHHGHPVDPVTVNSSNGTLKQSKKSRLKCPQAWFTIISFFIN
ncbi:putative capsid protein [Sewage-associated circular DNA virus-2]|uniref:putative capsid protein n=1 Tax=Sewage-associated circular DNA virus-2 TaxID=1519391 RepID=UPI0004D0C203|nr:putative capsid protein [Sewage-associated circular DNA virus-2]AIF34807.1 putative capsid protein [Sewage-associated circular DNA virus-2]